MSVLGALLDARLSEGFEEGKHPRGFAGKFIAELHHPTLGRTTTPVDASSTKEAWEKAAAANPRAMVQSVRPFDGGARRIIGQEGDAKARSARAADVGAPTAGEVWRTKVSGGQYRVTGTNASHVQFKSERTGADFTIPQQEFRQGYERVGERIPVSAVNSAQRDRVAPVTPRYSSGKQITAPQRRRLASVVSDITANASQDRSHMNDLISAALRDSGHTMGMTPGWVGKLQTNHATQLIKDLERLAKHGPGELAKPFEPVREAFAAPAPTAVSVTPRETPQQSMQRATADVAGARAWQANLHPRGSHGRFGYKGGSRKRAKRSAAGTSATLHPGATGALVSAVQRQLHVPASGTYDAATQAAVRRFQTQHGLLVDGIVGAQTLSALRGGPRVAPGRIPGRMARVANPRARSSSRRAPARRAPAKAKTPTANATPGSSFAGGRVVR